MIPVSQGQLNELVTRLGRTIGACPFCGAPGEIRTSVAPRGTVTPRLWVQCSKEHWANTGEVRYMTDENFNSKEYNEKYIHQAHAFTLIEAVEMALSRWNRRLSPEKGLKNEN